MFHFPPLRSPARKRPLREPARGSGSAVSSHSGVRGNARPQTHFVAFWATSGNIFWHYKRCFCLTSVAYIVRNLRTVRPRKTKISTEVAHVTRDSDTTFKDKGQLVADVFNSQHAGTVATWRINTKILSTCRSRGRRHIVAAARLPLVYFSLNWCTNKKNSCIGKQCRNGVLVFK